MKNQALPLCVILLGVLGWLAFNQSTADHPPKVSFESLKQLDTLAYTIGYQENPYRGLELYDSLLLLTRTHFPDSLKMIENVLYSQGGIHNSLRNFQKALDLFLAGLKTLDSIPDLPQAYKAWTIHAVGVAYSSLENYPKATEYFELALSMREKAAGKNSLTYAYTLNELGRMYRDKGDYELAIQHIEEVIKIHQSLKSSEVQLISPYTYLAFTYQSMRAHKISISYFEKALNIVQKANSPNSNKVAQALLELGSAYLQNREYEKAEALLDEALQIYLQNLGPKSSIIARVYNDLAVSKSWQKDYRAANRYMDKAIQASNYTDSIHLSQVNNFQNLLIFMGNKTKYLHELYLETDSLHYLYQMESFTNQGIQILEYAQTHFKSEEVSLQLLDEAYEIFENGILAQFQLGRAEMGQDSKQNISFQYGEQSKSTLIRQTYFNSTAQEIAGIPEAIMEQELELKKRLTEYRTIMNNLGSKQDSDSLNLVIQTKIYELNRQHEEFLNQTKEKYPKYFNLRYKSDVISIEEVQQQLLKPNQGLVEYFVGENDIFIFLILPDNHYQLQVQKDFALDSLVHQMRESIYNSALDTLNREDWERQYLITAHELYQKIFQPIESLFSKNTELIIIPDGALSLIPFNALISKIPGKEDSPRDYSYLINNYSISYAFSATLLLEMQRLDYELNPFENILVVAPSFLENDPKFPSNFKSKFSPLVENQREVEAITTYFRSKVLMNERATKEEFISSARDYPIIHLTTHGKANLKTGENSYLVFHPTGLDEEGTKLFVRELYNLDLNSQLVVLSACETGLGQWRRGEGIISLARAFNYAGAKSIVSSLWKVEGQSTSELMGHFYKYLDKGKTKNEALRQAQLDYIQKAPRFEPFYWAGFIPIGDMAPIAQPSSLWSYLYLSIIGLVLFLGYWIFTRNRKKV